MVVHPWLYEKRRLIVRGEPFLVITGEIQHQGGAINVVARDVIPLEQARRHYDDISFETMPIPPARTLEDPVASTERTTLELESARCIAQLLTRWTHRCVFRSHATEHLRRRAR